MHGAPDSRVVSRREDLLTWYHSVRRDFPWRHTTDPYRILVSEIMLQQTQAARVVPFYERFVERYPDVDALADADLAEVLSLWKGLGYPSRARRLREAARVITSHGWPDSAAALESLPGVGPYTAAAVASFAFGEHIGVIDTNVRRVVSRWHGVPLSGRRLQQAVDEELAPPADQWNQAVMELGAMVCHPRRPRCADCPVAESCIDPGAYQPPPRQSPFNGSDRQKRGRVLAALVDGGPTDLATVATSTAIGSDRLARVVETLEEDGLVLVEGGRIRLAD